MSRLRSLGPLLAAGLAFVSVYTRQVGVPKAQAMWAEDGYVFLGCHTRGDSALNCLGEAYGGYLHMVPRLGAMLAWIGPPDLWAVAVTTAAAAALGAAAFLVAAAIRDATGSELAGIAGGAALGLPYEAGHEVAGNLANLHWILFAAAVLIVVAAWLGRAPRGLDLAAVAGMTLSSALGPIIAILAGAGWLTRKPGCGRLAVVALVGSLIQAGVAITVPRDPPLHDPLGLDVALRAFVANVLIAGPFGPSAPGPGWALAALVATLAGIAAVLATRQPRRPAALTAIAALIVAGLVAYVTAALVNRWEGPRYAYAPGVLLIEAAIVGAALIAAAINSQAVRRSSRWLPRLPLVLAVAVVAIGAVSSYRLESRTSNGPDYDLEFAAAISRCLDGATESVRVPISPWPSDRTWTVEVPCDRVAVRSQ